MEHLHEINWDNTAFKKLVLGKEKKRLIKGLVTNHVVDSASADLIEGKGNGLGEWRFPTLCHDAVLLSLIASISSVIAWSSWDRQNTDSRKRC